jgi:signal transduction histidine kinase
LPGLLDHAQSAGLRTDLDLQVNGVLVPSAVGGAAYRIVQEALTNVLRHADASSAHVGVRTTAKSLDIEVTDDGRSSDPDVSPGLGLRGMTERATALGGSIDVGPRATGGWRVHAVLPLNGSEPR